MGGGGDGVEETEQAKAFAETSNKRWNDYQQKFKPFEDSYMSDVDRMNSDSQYQQATDMSAIPVESNFSKAVEGSAQQMTQRGINPNSGMFKGEIDKIEENRQKVKADSMNQGTAVQQNRYVGGLQNITRMGQGQETEAVNGMADIAGMAEKTSINNLQNDMQSSSDNQTAVGTAVGAGTRYGLGEMDGGE
tara:strand:- start:155297 stop:155869 length:573 start_codon:yes stop_codon:yes gene_type:complete